MLHFYARNPAGVRRRLRLIHRLPSLIHQFTGRGSFIVNFVHLSPGPDAAVRYINLKLSEHGADPAQPRAVRSEHRDERPEEPRREE